MGAFYASIFILGFVMGFRDEIYALSSQIVLNPRPLTFLMVGGVILLSLLFIVSYLTRYLERGTHNEYLFNKINIDRMDERLSNKEKDEIVSILQKELIDDTSSGIINQIYVSAQKKWKSIQK